MWGSPCRGLDWSDVMFYKKKEFQMATSQLFFLSETLYHRDDALLYIAYVMLIWAVNAEILCDIHIFTLFAFVKYPLKYIQCENIFYHAM